MTKCAFNKGTKCAALVCMECAGCAFRKSLAELEKGRRMARVRIGLLPTGAQDKIRRKYYTNGQNFSDMSDAS